MEKGKQAFLTFFIFFFLAVNHEGVEGHKPKPKNWKRLFVFGDSYADTGNNLRPTTESWMIPYGMSFPGKPDGRWSNGFVLTDHIAKYMRIRTPVAYRSWRNHGLKKLKYGVNYAYGGTGVFTIPSAPYPNMTQQIDFFERMLKKNVYTSHDLQNSVSLVTLAGNDYMDFVTRTNWTVATVLDFMTTVNDQLKINVKRISSLGVKQVLVANLQPLGCLPLVTEGSGYSQCNDLYNILVTLHNDIVQSSVNQLVVETGRKDYQPFILLDVNSAFDSVFKNNGVPSVNLRYQNPMAPCCMGVNDDYYCASVEKNGTKMYTLCDDPKKTFFWDRVHPSHHGWKAVTWLLRGALNNITDLPHRRH
ncbi:hypothetical protein Ancab_031652 [Ancistrocladus abbreviatus]